MIIYLEGPDGSGKTTFVQKIWDTLARTYFININAEDDIPTRPNRKDRITEKALFSKLKAMAKSQVLYVLDRGPISDIIYRIFDEHKSVTSLAKIRNFMKNWGNKVLYVCCNTPKAEQNMIARGDDNPVALQHHKEITKLYDTINSLIKSDCPYSCVDYDFSKPSSVTFALKTIKYFMYINTGRQIDEQ